jgi:catechol 2,3-dioxygenase-like lactoylglutathione lyase family enzyme
VEDRGVTAVAERRTRRETIRQLLELAALSLASLLVAVLLAPISVARAPGAPVVAAVRCVGMTVSDLERSVDFYTGVLSFERASAAHEVAGEPWERLTGVFGLRTRTARLRLGDECLELTEYVAPVGRPPPADARSNDRWFQHVAIAVADMDRAYAALRAARVEHASTGPQRLPDSIPAAAGIRAFYFKDPDRHVLEAIQFPPGKGDPRWHEPAGERLFLGIDHTAIVVADTTRSLRFYRDALGLQVAGTSENWGTEQEHLNNVQGARLRITTLRAADGPGVELLE